MLYEVITWGTPGLSTTSSAVSKSVVSCPPSFSSTPNPSRAAAAVFRVSAGARSVTVTRAPWAARNRAVATPDRPKPTTTIRSYNFV